MALLINVLLLVIGGLVTFLVMYVHGRLVRRSADIQWRLLPPVLLASERLTAFALVIENRGTSNAKTLRVLIQTPDASEITSLEVEPSESALRFERLHHDQANRVEVLFPDFHSSMACALTCLVRSAGTRDLTVSVLGDDDVIGRENRGISREDVEKSRLRFSRFYIGSIGVMVLLVIGMFGFSTMLALDSIRATRLIEIGDLYSQMGHYDLALREYSTPTRYFRALPPPLVVTYKIAATYARMGKEEDAVRLLGELTRSNGGPELAVFARLDPAFDGIRGRESVRLLLDKVDASLTKGN